MALDETEAIKLNASKFSLAADYYAKSVPGLSRIYMKELDKIKLDCGLPTTPAYQSCKFCGSIFRPGNHKVKFFRKMRLHKKIKKLLQRKEDKGQHSLGKFQRKLVEFYLNSTTRVVMVCGACKKKTILACPSKPDKVARNEISEPKPVKMTKAAKKKMKQKKRRMETAKEKASCGSFDILDKKSKDTCNILNTSKSGTSKLSTLYQVKKKETPSTSESNVDTQSKKKKGKTFSQTLQKMLNREHQQNNTSSKSSLQRFLSNV